MVRQVRLPHRILTILEGESLVNDASALLVYRLAVLTAVSGSVSLATIIPTFLLVIVGSVVAWRKLAASSARSCWSRRR